MSTTALAQPATDLPADSVQILIVDRNTASRIGLGVLLGRQPWVARCLAAADIPGALTLSPRTRPDVAIVAISELQPTIVAELAALRRSRPGMAILLSWHRGVAAVPLAAGLGIAGSLRAEAGAGEIIATVRHALVGERLPASTGETEAGAVGGLSGRERQVLALLSTGATNSEIAAQMHVGTETVKKHARAVYRKLGVRNRTEAAQLALGNLSAG